jgi:hypothetical protein
MGDMFDLFTTTSYTFLQLDNDAGGFTVVAEYPTTGIVKMRDGMAANPDYEEQVATGTVHIRATESFVTALGANLVGHAIRVAKGDYNEATYRIDSQVEGYDYDNGETAFYKVTLKPEESWDESELSLT